MKNRQFTFINWLKKGIFLTLLLTTLNLFSQGYNIKVTIKNYKNDTLLLGYHFGNKQYIKDTAYRTKDYFVFSSDTVLEPGMYLIVLQPNHDFFQLLIEEGKQQFSLETSEERLSEDLVYKGSKLNEAFLKYIDFIAEKRLKVDSLSNLIKTETDSIKRLKLKADIDELDKQVKSRQSYILKEQPKSLLSLIIRWSLDVDIPDFSSVSNTERDQYIFNYYREHFFDNADFRDDRSVRLPLVFPKIDQFVQRLTMQHPDSISLALDIILNKCDTSSELYKFLLSHYLNFYANSKYVGMDGVYVHLVEHYYSTGKAPWIDAENLAKMVSDAKSLKPLLIDKVAPNLKVFGRDSSPIFIHNIDSQFLILFFWSPDCGHCKKSIPYMVDFYNKYMEKGVEILSICTKLGPEEKTCWETIDSLKLTKWINATDPSHSSRFKLVYDLKTTPQIYILDRRKKILTKKIGAEQLSDVMDKLLKTNANEE